MTVSNGQLANQTTFNNAFASKSAANTLTGVQTLNETASGLSGSSIANLQRTINSFSSAIGIVTSEVFNFTITWASNIVGSAGDTIKARLEAHTLKFRGAASQGHAHDGTDGQSEKIQLANLLATAYTAGAVLFRAATDAIGSDATEFFWDITNSRLGLGTNAPNTKLDVNGGMAIRRTAQATAASITALATPTSFIGFTGSTATTLHGIDTGVDGKELVLHNESSATVTIKHDSGTAGSAAMRIYTATGGDFVLGVNKGCRLKYNATLSRWVLDSSSGSGSGGASSLDWYIPDSGGASESVLSNGMKVFVFSDAETSSVFAQFTIPEGYTPGQQIFLKNGKVFSPTTSGNFLIRTVAYIFKVNIDGTSTPTGHTSTNSAQAIDGTTNEIVVVSSIDITNASGQINSVAVAAGDTILVKLSRLPTDAADTLADDLKLLAGSFELDVTA